MRNSPQCFRSGFSSLRRVSILSSSILLVSVASIPAATFVWDNVSGTWSTATNWQNDVVPVSEASTDLIFGGAGDTAYISTHDLASPFTLNSLTLNSSAAVAEQLDGNELDFQPDDTGAQILQEGSGGFLINTAILANNPLTFAGTGTGITQLAGAINGFAGLSFSSARWQLSNSGNTFSGGLTINTGAFLELVPTFGGDEGINLSPSGASHLGSDFANVVTIDGGTLKVTTSGSGGNASAIILGGRPLTFGASGGVFDLTNTSGTPDVQGGGIATSGGGDLNLTLNNAPESPAVIRFNGGEVGISTGNANDANWSVGNNALRINAFGGTGPLRIELSNGAMFRGTTGAGGTINPPLTIRGPAGGDPTSGPDGTVNSGTSRTLGRVALDNQNVTTYAGGLTLEGALQIGVVNTTRAINGNIVIAGTASGNPGHVAFTGRGTNTQLNQNVNNPGTNTAGQNVLWIGQGQNDTLTVQSGGIARFDPRVRTDTAGSNGNGVLLDGTVILHAGATLRIAQSISNFTPGIAQTSANAGDIIIRGDIRGEGSTAADAVLEIALPAPQPGASVDSGIPASLTATSTTAGERPYGGLRFEDQTGNADLIINGTGFGGLRVNGIARPNGLIQGGVDDPVSTLTKVNDVLTAARLARVGGTGGYLTIAPSGQTYVFPAGGEWADTDIGLKVADHNAGGTDVSLDPLTSWSRNLAVDSAATLDVGSAGTAFALNGGILAGKGTITGTRGLITSPGTLVAPGLNDVGALAINTALTLNGALSIEVSGVASDLLSVGGNLTLGGPLALSGAFGTTNLTIASYSGTLSGTFAGISGMDPDFTIDYGSGANSAIRLIRIALPTITWEGAPGNTWQVGGGNWKDAAVFENGNKVVFDDTANGSTNVVVSGGDVSPGLITVSNASKDYTITSAPGSAVIGGTALIKNGVAALTLAGPANFGGGITINGGELRIGAPNSLPDASAVVIAPGATLNTQGNSDTLGELTVNGSVAGGGTLTVGGLNLGSGVSVSPSLTLNGNVTKTGATGSTLSGAMDLGGAVRTFDVSSGTAPELTLSGAISNGGISKRGAGTMTLSHNGNTFTGGLNVIAGILRALEGALPANNNVAVAEGATIDLTGFNSLLGSLDISGTLQTGGGSLVATNLTGTASGVLSMEPAGSLTINQTGTSLYPGSITAGGLIKNGTGTLALSGSNSFSADTQVNAGILGINGGNAAGFGAINVNSGGVLDLAATIGNIINLNGGTLGSTGTRNFNGTLNVTTASVITHSDPENPNAGAEFIILGEGLQGSGDLTVRGIAATTGADTVSGVRMRSTAPSNYSGTITVLNATKFESQMAEGGTNPIGTGKVRLTAGTFAGNLQGTYSQFNIRTAGGDPVFGTDVEILGLGLGNINPVTTGDVTSDQRLTLGRLTIGDGQILGVNKNGAPTLTVIFPTATLTGGTATLSPNTFGFGYSGIANLEIGTISESAAGSGIVMDGQASLLLSAANSYTGSTQIDRGTTRLGAAGALPASTRLIMNDGTLEFFNGIDASFDQTVAQLSGIGGIISNGDVQQRTFTVNQATDSEFAGSIIGSIGLVKQGAGSLTLSGFSTPAFASTVAGGSLLITGALAGEVRVQGGGALRGTGTTGAVNVESGGTLAPGVGLGVLSTGGVTLGDASSLQLELNARTPGIGYDQLNVAGAVSIDSSATLLLSLGTGFDPVDDTDIFTVILNDLDDPVSGTFAGLPNGSIVFAGTQAFQISYADDALTPAFELAGGNDVSLLAIPEPASFASLLAGSATLLGIRRFRRRP